MKSKITWREARDIMLAATVSVDDELLPLSRSAGRFLSQPVRASRNVPPFDRAAVDGYAFRSGDTAGEHPTVLHVLEEVPAGNVPTQTVVPGTATKILTGAPIPSGADVVAKYEETDFSPETVMLKRAYHPSENIIRQGEDVSVGEQLANTGQRIDAGMAGALAAQGIGKVAVYRRPMVAVITTGSELVSPEERIGPGKIPNSSRYALEAALEQVGCAPRFFGTPKDDAADIAKLVAEALEETDAVITTGGVSVGDYDLTAKAYEMAGIELLCGDLRLKPGGKSCFGRKGRKPVMGLSGNPASAMTCFYAVALPVLRKLQGRSDVCLPEFPAKLAVSFKKGSPHPRLVRGGLAVENGGLAFYPAGKQGNGSLQSLAGASTMAEIAPESGPVEAGAVLNVIYFGGQ